MADGERECAGVPRGGTPPRSLRWAARREPLRTHCDDGDRFPGMVPMVSGRQTCGPNAAPPVPPASDCAAAFRRSRASEPANGRLASGGGAGRFIGPRRAAAMRADRLSLALSGPES